MSKDITPSCPRSGTVPDCPVQGHVPSKYQHCIQACMVSAERLHLLAVTRSVPPEKALSIGTLVAITNIKINLKIVI